MHQSDVYIPFYSGYRLSTAIHIDQRGRKKKENQNTEDHFVNSVPRIEKSPYLAQTLRKEL